MDKAEVEAASRDLIRRNGVDVIVREDAWKVVITQLLERAVARYSEKPCAATSHIVLHQFIRPALWVLWASVDHPRGMPLGWANWLRSIEGYLNGVVEESEVEDGLRRQPLSRLNRDSRPTLPHGGRAPMAPRFDVDLSTEDSLSAFTQHIEISAHPPSPELKERISKAFDAAWEGIAQGLSMPDLGTIRQDFPIDPA